MKDQHDLFLQAFDVIFNSDDILNYDATTYQKNIIQAMATVRDISRDIENSKKELTNEID